MSLDRFKNEIALIDNALISEQGEISLRNYLKPFVESNVRKYLNKHPGIDDVNEERLLLAGCQYLDSAMRNYRKHAEKMLSGKTRVYCFTDYFAWYIRQGVADYLESLK
jgi:hypothetical protein